MSIATEGSSTADFFDRIRLGTSRVIALTAILLIGVTFFLISPDPDATFPGSIAWSNFSILHLVVRAMSLGGLVATQRGVEIKEFAFHLAAAIGLGFLAIRIATALRGPFPWNPGLARWFVPQALLIAWVLVSLVSSLWSGDPEISRGQAAIYGIEVGWAVALGWSLSKRGAERIVRWLVGFSSAGALICIWYYYERNPFHRPGFPIGNPGTLAAALLPAILAAICLIARDFRRWRAGAGAVAESDRAADRTADSPIPVEALACAVALVPLGWCFWLVEARAALIGLLVGLVAAGILAGTTVFRLNRRWILTVACSVLVAGGATGWLVYRSTGADFTRNATVRFRLYMWRYAAELWSQRPISGLGAGSFSRLVGVYQHTDKVLDPAAFMGDWAGHAHNELFEVMTEIGLVGALTFVGGFVATIGGGLALIRRAPDDDRWIYIALVAGLVAMISESMFNVSLRLAAVPAILYTALGVVWASGREMIWLESAVVPPVRNRFARLLTLAPAAALTVVVICAGLVGWMGIRNWNAVLEEQRGYALMAKSHPAAALHEFVEAESGLLDPTRRLFADLSGVRCRFELARAAFEEVRTESARPGVAATATLPASRASSEESSASTRPAASAAVDEALRLRSMATSKSAYDAALKLSQRAPMLGDMPAIAAKAAEMLAVLYTQSDAGQAAEWSRAAFAHWSEQRYQDRYDTEALLALTRYPNRVDAQIVLLCEALRSGFPPREWFDSFERLIAQPGFEETLAIFLLQAGPIDPRTELNALIVSMAPEVYRFSAFYAKRRGAYEDALRYAGRAASLYESMRPRFPLLYSMALVEEAESAFRANYADPKRAVELAQAALDALPIIQRQQYDRMAFEFRRRLALYQLADGAEKAAAQTIASAYGPENVSAERVASEFVLFFDWFREEPSQTRPPIESWVRAALRLKPDHLAAWSRLAWLAAKSSDPEGVERTLTDAAKAGVPSAGIELIRRSLAKEFPALGETLGGDARPPGERE